jgi:hypothetical protein
MKVTFKCGHTTSLERDVQEAPVCHCGERIVKSVTGATPRFTGACTGPLVEKA